MLSEFCKNVGRAMFFSNAPGLHNIKLSLIILNNINNNIKVNKFPAKVKTNNYPTVQHELIIFVFVQYFVMTISDSLLL